MTDPNRFHLTPREIEVLTHVLRGEGNKQIAGALGITEQAIKDHVSTLLDKRATRTRIMEKFLSYESLGLDDRLVVFA